MGKSKKLKHIVIISPYLYELTRGIERYCLCIAKAFLDEGIKITMYVWSAENGQSCGEVDPRIKIRVVPRSRYFQDKVASIMYNLWLPIDSPDCTILNFMYHGEQYLPKKGSYLYVLHSPASQIPTRYENAKAIVSKFKKIHIIAISKIVENDAIPYFRNVPISLIYNGTDTRNFKPCNQHGQSDTLKIISAAAFEPRKGMHFMIEALKSFNRKFVYHIYGTGDKSYNNYLSKLITENHLEDSIVLKGSVSNINEILPQYDLSVLLSKGEAFALSPIEALACGVPIMVSQYPPYPEFVDDSFGFIVNREDPKQILSKLEWIVNNRGKFHKMKETARVTAERFSWSSVIKNYINVINDLIK